MAVVSGMDAGGYEFGNYRYVTVKGSKWHDLGADGVWDIGERPLAGWTVRALAGDSVVDAGVTGDAGAFGLSVRQGTYTIAEDGSAQRSATVP